MSFLIGKQKQVDRTPSDITGLRGDLVNNIRAKGTDIFNPDPSEDFINRVLGPAREMFASNREMALAQAKEQAGNLTGSGYGNALGETVNRSLSEENNFLGQLYNQERQRQLQRAGLILNFATAGVAPPETTYQPGFLDYLFQGASAAGKGIGMAIGAPTGLPAMSAPGGYSYNDPTYGGSYFEGG